MFIYEGIEIEKYRKFTHKEEFFDLIEKKIKYVEGLTPAKYTHEKFYKVAKKNNEYTDIYKILSGKFKDCYVIPCNSGFLKVEL